MDRFYDADNPLMQFLSRLVDLAVLNLMTVAAMLPVVTAGAGLAAMNNVLIHLQRGDGTYVWKMFLTSLRQNLKQGIVLSLLFEIIAAVLASELILLHAVDAKAATVLMIMLSVLSACVLAAGVYTFALQARYENRVAVTLMNAAKLTLGHPGRSLAMVIIWALLALALWYIRGIALLAFLLYGLSIPGYLCTMLYDPVFRKMESEDESASQENN